MKIEELVKIISMCSKDRFEIDSIDEYSEMLLKLGSDILHKKQIIRIQRVIKNSEKKLAQWKTLLIVEIENTEDLKYAIEWAASVKDTLLDPETADLYLFIIFDVISLNLEYSLRIESNEHFCRKYVQRSTESVQELIERTFLGQFEKGSQEEISIDPINKALLLTGKNFEWFTEIEQKKWKELCLSSHTGGELIDLLIPEISENK